MRLFFAFGVVSFADQGSPSWLPDEVKNQLQLLHEHVEGGPAQFVDETACQYRQRALTALATTGEPQAGQVRSQILQELGMCSFAKKDYRDAEKKFQAAISELNAPNEDLLMKNPSFAPMVLLRDAASGYKRHQLSLAATALRRSQTIFARELKKVLENVSKQNNLDLSNKQVYENVMAQLSKNPGFVQLQNTHHFLSDVLEDLDSRIPGSSSRKKALSASTSAYFPGVPMDKFIDAERLVFLKNFLDNHAAIKKELNNVDTVLFKRAQKGVKCDTYPHSCKLLEECADVSTNGFGETRVMKLKPGKKQKLEMCETNGNIAVIYGVSGAVDVSVDGTTIKVEEGKAVGVDFCLPVSLKSEGATVLFMQAWNPEIGALERSTYIRERSKNWGLSDSMKDVLKVMNAAAKKSWDKTNRLYRTGSKVGEEIVEKMKLLEQEAVEEKERAAEAKRKEEEASDAEHQENIRKLAEMRKEREQKQAEKAAAIAARAAKAKAEQVAKSPEYLDPNVAAAQERLESLKDQRREANAHLEFDDAASLNPRINEAERTLESELKKAKKRMKKLRKRGKNVEGEYLVVAVEELTREKDAAVAREDFSTASKLKPQIASKREEAIKVLTDALSKIADDHAAALKAGDERAAGNHAKRTQAVTQQLARAKGEAAAKEEL